MRLSINTPNRPETSLLLGVVKLECGIQLKLMLDCYNANPELPRVRALTICDDDSTDLYAILSSGAADLAGTLRPWEIALKSAGLNASAQRAILRDGLLMPTGCVVTPRCVSVWRIEPMRLPQDVRAQAQKRFGWPDLPDVSRLAANDPQSQMPVDDSPTSKRPRET